MPRYDGTAAVTGYRLQPAERIQQYSRGAAVGGWQKRGDANGQAPQRNRAENRYPRPCLMPRKPWICISINPGNTRRPVRSKAVSFGTGCSANRPARINRSFFSDSIRKIYGSAAQKHRDSPFMVYSIPDVFIWNKGGFFFLRPFSSLE